MAATFLDEARTESDSAADHVTDHNEIHYELNQARYLEAAVHADSDYFDNEDFTAWTELDVSGNTTWAEKWGRLSVNFDTITAGDVAVQTKAITSAVAPITIECEVSLFVDILSATSIGAGIFFADGDTATDDLVFCTFYIDTSNLTVALFSGTHTAFTTNTEGSNTFGGPAAGQAITKLWLRLTWDSANTWSAYVSPDRVSWHVIVEGAAHTMTPTHFGLGLHSGGAANPSTATFRFFEVTDADLGSAA
jgi:hypothetical protein